MTRTLKLYRLADTHAIAGFRAMKAEDTEAAYRLLNDYLKQFALAPRFSVDEFVHWLMPRTGVVDTFVVEVNN